MFTTALIAFREFLEAFLLIGIFVGLNKKLHLRKQKEIILAALLGIGLSLLLPTVVFFVAGDATRVLNEDTTDLLEGYLLTFSGFFLAYVIFSLHEFIKDNKRETIMTLRTKMEHEIFDISLFFTIVFFILREGFEVTLLVASTSLFSTFLTSIEGLFLGFIAAASIGTATFFTYVTLPVKKLFTYTEYLILVVGAAMVKNGSSILFQHYTHVNLATIFPLPFHFLPERESIGGHVLNTITGLQQEFSLTQFGIMAVYIASITLFFKKAK